MNTYIHNTFFINKIYHIPTTEGAVWSGIALFASSQCCTLAKSAQLKIQDNCCNFWDVLISVFFCYIAHKKVFDWIILLFLKFIFIEEFWKTEGFYSSKVWKLTMDNIFLINLHAVNVSSRFSICWGISPGTILSPQISYVWNLLKFAFEGNVRWSLH